MSASEPLQPITEWIDLTQTLSEHNPTLPLHPKPEFEDFATLEEDDYNSTILHIETHCGTHMDAPTHFLSKDDHLNRGCRTAPRNLAHQLTSPVNSPAAEYRLLRLELYQA